MSNPNYDPYAQQQPQYAQQPQYYAPPQQPQYAPAPPAPKGSNGLGIAALVLGIVGGLVGLIPILGWIGLVACFVGVVLGAIGAFRVPRGLAIAGVIVSILGLILGFASNASFANSVSGGRDVTGVGSSAAPAGGLVPAPAKNAFSAGETADIEGLQITVAVPKQVTDKYSGALLCTDVNYTNNSNEQRSFNVFSWELQGADNVITNATPRIGGDKSLNSGDLAPGGKVAGEVCWKKPAPGSLKIIFKETIVSSETVTWAAKLG